MKNFLIRILLAAAFVVAAFALASSTQAQQADEDPTTATPRRQRPPQLPSRLNQRLPRPLLAMIRPRRHSLSPAGSLRKGVIFC